MLDNFTEPLTIVFKLPTMISIGVLSAILKYSICEHTDCSLCSNQWITYTVFVAMAIVTIFIVTIFIETSNRSNVPATLYDSKFIRFLIVGTLFHTFSLASSSFVEEEHQTWYFFTHTFLFIICGMSLKKRQSDQWFLNVELLKSDNRMKRWNVRVFFEKFFFEFIWFVLFGMLLVGRRLNQTGDKWLSLPDIGDFLSMEEHRLWNSCFVVIC